MLHRELMGQTYKEMMMSTLITWLLRKTQFSNQMQLNLSKQMRLKVMSMAMLQMMQQDRSSMPCNGC